MTHRFEQLRRLARLVPGGMAAGRAARRWLDPDLREIIRLKREESAALLQPFPDTFEDRYPALFDALALRLADHPAPRILSFGCSSGAEVRALRRRLPRVRFTGIDPNRRALARARAADPHGDYRAGTAPAEGDSFDAILAMAVLRHGALEAERPDRCDAVLPFERVAETVAGLERSLAPGGWLAVGNAHFRVSDCPAAAALWPDPQDFGQLSRPNLLYGPDGRRIESPGPVPVLFHKPA